MNSEQQKHVLKNINKQITVIWSIIVLGLVLFLAITYFFVKQGNTESNFSDFILLSYLTYIVVITSIPGGYYLFERIVKKQTNDIVKVFKKAYFTKYIIFASAGILSCILYLLSGKSEGIYTSAIVITTFLINKPSINSFLRLR